MKKLLVVVDMQNDFVTGVLGTPEAKDLRGKIKDYITSFEGDVVFTRDTHKENYLETQEGSKLPVVHCVKGTPGWEIIPELWNLAEDRTRTRRIFDKPTFGSTELAEFIRDEEYEYVEFCGVCTGICVISNEMVLKAFCPEVKIATLQNLCACVSPVSHATAISAMQTCQIDIIEG
jgi:nicotinamidase-related amidase